MPPPVNAVRKRILDAKDALYKIITKQKNAGVAEMGALIAEIPVADLNSLHTTGKTLLTKAIDMKAIATIKLLIAAGADPNVFIPKSGIVGIEDNSYLNLAVTAGDEILTYFLTLGINVNKGREPAILVACRDTKNGIDLVKKLVAAGADINKKGGVDSKSALIEACAADNSKLVTYLLANGADVRTLSANDRNALYSCALPRSLNIFKSLVAAGLDINSVDANGRTPLFNYFKNLDEPVIYRPTIDIVNFFGANGARFDIVVGGANLFHLCCKNLVFVTNAGAHTSIVRVLGERGVPVNASDGNNITPLLFAINRTYENVDVGFRFIKELLKVPGIDINKSGAVPGKFLYISPLMYLVWLGFYGIAEFFIDAGADINLMNDKGDTVLHQLAAGVDVPDSMWTKIVGNPAINIDIKNFAQHEFTPMHIAARKGRFLNNMKKLVDAGADVNITDSNGHTPVYHAAHFVNRAGLDYLLRLPTVDKKITYNATPGRAGQTLYDLALAGVAFKDAAINGLITELCAPAAGPQEMWAGWSRGDAAGFESIFAEDRKEAADTSVCPICLKTARRIDGCAYIQGHDCSREEGFYHKELYEKYKMPSGCIVWCTICGRICNAHQHYKLGPATGDKPPLYPRGNDFTLDCSKGEGGGGLMEKLARYRRLREYAFELKDDVGTKTKKKALEELVEEMWNAPMVRKGILPKLMAERRWNIPSDAFPMPPEAPAEAEIDMATLPPITKPADAGGPPEIVQGEDKLYVEVGVGPVIKFHHKQTGGPAVGQVFHHENLCVSKEGLESFIASINARYKQDGAFGLCWAYPGNCNGRLYPEEIQQYFVDAADPARDAELKAMFSEYKMKFNWKFRARVGGRRKTRKQRKTRRLRVGGANIANVFVPATNAQCSLRPRNNTRKLNKK